MLRTVEGLAAARSHSRSDMRTGMSFIALVPLRYACPNFGLSKHPYENQPNRRFFYSEFPAQAVGAILAFERVVALIGKALGVGENLYLPHDENDDGNACQAP